MTKNRLESFSDCVLSILMTIMVLELHAPNGETLAAWEPLVPIFLSYVMSFGYLAIYWNNHHHMLHASHGVNGQIMWANMHLLFWLSLFPAVTSWVGHDPLASWPLALYGVVLFMAAIAYMILQAAILRHTGRQSVLAQAIGKDFKGKISPLLYLLGIALAFVWPLISNLMYAFVALMWIIPDPRIEKRLQETP